MWTRAREISEGDVVILWLTRDNLEALIITPGKVYNGRFGVYRHDDLVGVPYGSKVISKNGKGFVHVLRPTPELWTLALPHRTQILYLADISFITSWLDLKPGSIVIEAGTGSGSFSHSACRTIQPHGHLHSFEYHEERSKKARTEFKEHGMADLVTLEHRNVCKDGFGLEDAADAVFLDLPAPWDAIAHAKAALKKDRTGRICCFSPCMEQVLRTVSALNEAGFTEITMYETLLRPQEVVPVTLPPIGQVMQRLKNAEVEAEGRRLRQIAKANERNKKRKFGETGHVAANMGTATESTGRIPCKKPKTDEEVASSEGGEDGELVEGPSNEHSNGKASRSPVTGQSGKTPLPEGTFHVTRPFTEVRGHTSYLTFAVLLPYACVQPERVQATQSSPSNGAPGTVTQSAPDTQFTGDDPSWEAAALSLTVEELEAMMGSKTNA